MRLKHWVQASLGATLGAVLPITAMAAGSPALSVTQVVGKEAVHVTGFVPGARQLQAVLYAHFSKDLPTVLLSRRPLATDANGNFSTTLPIASAYFRGATVTVVVQSSSAVPLAQGSVSIAAPNVPAPADELPPDYR